MAAEPKERIWIEVAKVGIPAIPAVMGLVLAYHVGDTFADVAKKRADADLALAQSRKTETEEAELHHHLEQLRGVALPRIGTSIHEPSERPIRSGCFVTGGIVVENLGEVPVEVTSIDLSIVEVATDRLNPAPGVVEVQDVSYNNLLHGGRDQYATVVHEKIESLSIRLAPTASASFSYAEAIPGEPNHLWGFHASVRATAIKCADVAPDSKAIPCFQDKKPDVLTNNYYDDFASTELKERCVKHREAPRGG